MNPLEQALSDIPMPQKKPIDELISVEADSDKEDVFIGREVTYPFLGVYGGHFVGQGLMAGFKTIDENLLANSVHVNFLKAGKAGIPLVYRVERLRDGRQYSARTIRAYQNDALLVSMTASFKLLEGGDEHQIDFPQVPTVEESVALREKEGRNSFMMPISPFGVEMEPLDDFHPMNNSPADPKITQWIRGPVSDTATEQDRQCVLAYLSDSTLMFNVLRPYGAMTTHRATSLDHSIWFHHKGDPSQWMLFDQQGPVAADSRGLNHGSIFEGSGKLIASVAQESMLKRL